MERRIVLTANKIGVGYGPTEIMLHALGFQLRGKCWSKGGWRNHFDPGEKDADFCVSLENGGYMRKSHRGTYWVTAAGRTALRLVGWKFADEEGK